MALTKEFMGCSLLERSLCLSSSSSDFQRKLQKNLSINPAFFVPVQPRRSVHLKKTRTFTTPVAAISEDLIKASVSATQKAVKFKVRAVLTVRKNINEDLKEQLVNHLDALTDKIGRNVVLTLLSTELDPKTKGPKRSREAVLKDWSKKSNIKAERVHYTADFTLDSDFGMPGAITVTNKHQKEFFLETITIEGFACGPVHFLCNSWVQSNKDHPGKRIFFTNQPYLPSETPEGLRVLREKELKDLRGDGKGVRKLSDRIYDFDVYNDLGNPDKCSDLVRPTLGGEQRPYPRRCRTGRVPTDTDMHAESRIEKPLPMYVPRDEQFEESKQDTFSTGRLKAVLHNLIPSLKASLSAANHDFNAFSDIDSLYSEGLLLNLGLQDGLLKKLPFPKVVSRIQESSQGLLRYDIPKILSRKHS
ncbi:hypothetical protein Pint_29161 [Pistacia integerrima]|uniref:Uncharacterized protein n=1 Tax=Pistacia integerrima TaxID=434235 RepID=A0ACC0X1P2_9ROSI|nr:hypothetical protein Pint_29161 [Pistacia integerrima]